MEIEGALTKSRAGLHRKGELPQVALCDIVSRDADGELLATPAEWDEDLGAAPKILVVLPAPPRQGAPRAGAGRRRPRAAANLCSPRDRRSGLRRPRDQAFVAGAEAGAGRVSRRSAHARRPHRRRGQKTARPRTFCRRGRPRRGAATAIWSAVETLSRAQLGLPQARVRERLGSMNSEKAISLIAINTHGIPDLFPPRDPRSRRARQTRAHAGGRFFARGLALAAAGDHRSARRQGPRRRGFCRARRRRRQPGRICRHRRHRRCVLLCARPTPRSTARRWIAAIRSISPTASCPCCPSAFPTTSARCARARTARRSPAGCASARTATSSATPSIA